MFIIFLFFSRKKEYKTYTFENLENINIYNALKPSEINKIYESHEISPIEQVIINTKGNFYLLIKNNIKIRAYTI